MITHDPQLLALRTLTAPILDTEEPLTHLNEISLSAQGAAVCGHVLIDLLEENDLAIGDYEVVIAPEGDGALAAAMIHAAGGRGLDLDAALLRPAQATALNAPFNGAPIHGRPAVLLANSSLVDTGVLYEAVKGAGATVVGVVSLLPDPSTRDFASEAGLTYCVPSLAD